ncbi:hypothetical protein V502_06317, partial [Pseudogymnoascus sp. VKM F-4520 (FW-2644)]
RHAQKDRPKEHLREPRHAAVFAGKYIMSAAPINFFSPLRQQQPILDTATPLQHPRILRAIVAFTYHIRAPELELLRQISRARPLDVLVVVVAPRVLAAHHVDLVVSTSVSADAFELWDCRDAAMRGLGIGAESERFDLREEDAGAGFAGCGGGVGEGEEGEEEGGEGGEEVHFWGVYMRVGGVLPVMSGVCVRGHANFDEDMKFGVLLRMRQRITFVHEPQDGIDPETIGIHTNTLSVSGLKAAREDHITLSLAELPQDLRVALSQTKELHIRYVTPASYDSLPPFNSQLSPGLHVYYTPKTEVGKGGQEFSDLLCGLIDTLFNLQDKSLCQTPEISFTSLPSKTPQQSTGYEYYLRDSQLSPGDASALRAYASRICQSTTCLTRVDEAAAATSIDLDFSSSTNTAKITTFWSPRTWDAVVVSKIDHTDRVELGILSNEKPIRPDDLNMSGFLTVLGESEKPAPTMFQFPSRHHKHPSRFSSAFIEPTGLHPTLQLSISSSQPPKNREDFPRLPLHGIQEPHRPAPRHSPRRPRSTRIHHVALGLLLARRASSPTS